MLNKNRNTSIDAIRLICAFFVVCQHVQVYPAYISQYVSGFARMAVPLFFLISGYHLYETDNALFKLKIKTTLLKIKNITVVYFLAYLLWWEFRSNFYKKDLALNFSEIISFIFLNGGVEHLWYLFAFMYALIFLNLFGNIIIHKYMLILMYITSFSISIYTRSIPLKYYGSWMELNWIAMALPYIILGAYIKKNKIEFMANTKIIALLILTSFFAIYIEHFLLKKYLGRGPSVIAIALFSVSVFLYCLRDGYLFPNKIKKLIARVGKMCSLDIYIHHIWVRDAILIIGLKEIVNSWIIFTIVCLTSYFIRVFYENNKK